MPTATKASIPRSQQEHGTPCPSNAHPKSLHEYLLAKANKRKKRKNKRREPPSSPIDINSADAKTLTQLPRIGKATASRIIELRNSMGGRFRSLKDLLKVKGIGPKTLEHIRPYVTLGSVASPIHRAEDDGDLSAKPPAKRKLHKKADTSDETDTDQPVRRRKTRGKHKVSRSKSEDDGDTKPRRRRKVARSKSEDDGNTKPRRRRKGQGRLNCYERWKQQQPAGLSQPININTASAEVLRKLPCIGKKRADAIVAIRSTQGPYQNYTDLHKIPGIGPKTLQWLKPHITLQLDINKATLEEFEALLPLAGGLGNAILRYRRKHGPFRDLKQLLRVRGLGLATLESLQPLLVISPSTPKTETETKTKSDTKIQSNPQTPPPQIIHVP
jgi:competence protein ComEA